MTWRWPETWLEAVPPRRVGGGALGGAPPVPPDGADVGRRFLERARPHLRAVLERFAPSAHRDAGLHSVAGEPGDWTPSGLAVIITLETFGGRDGPSLLDLALAERGPVFAAETVAERLGMRTAWHNGAVVEHTGREPWRIGGSWFDPARLLRARLAALPDEAYAPVVAALEFYRGGSAPQRLLASYLATDRADWAEADLADAEALDARREPRLLYGAARTVEQFLRMSALELARDPSTAVEDVATVLDVLGYDAAPVIAGWAHRTRDRAGRDVLWTALASLPTDAAFTELARRHGSPYAMPHVRAVMAREPERAARVLAALGSDLLAEHVVLCPDAAERVLPEVDDAAAGRIRALLGRADPVERVPVDELPPLLHRPPWTVKRTARPVVVDGLVATDDVVMVWRPGERARYRPERWTHVGHYDCTPERLDDLLAGRLDWHHTRRALSDWPDHVLAPVAHRIPLPDPVPLMSGDNEWLLALRFGAGTLPAVLAVARAEPVGHAGPLLPYGSTVVAVEMARWFATVPRLRRLTTAWFARHPATAARGLVPPALGKAGPGRRQAERVLRLLVSSGYAAEVRAAAAGYGPAAAAGVDALLRPDALPGRPPALPAWLDARLLPALRVPDGRALPLETVGHVCGMLAMGKPDEPYGGVEVVRAACDPASLEAFVWALVDRWRDAAYPTKERWTFTALGLVGGDDTLARLVEVLPDWAGDSASQPRAMLGLDVLAAIGTDGALMHLDRFSRKANTGTVRARAADRIDDVAAKRGLTADRLADRLVPDLDLDDAGSLVLDYGSRTFTVGFDEQLRPFVTDAAGAALKALPKPGSRDHASRAPAEYRRVTALKRAVRTVASEQVRRFERAMVWQRRWTGAELHTLFVVHPLLQYLARRLVWATDDGASFRVAEDRTYADVNDDPYEVPDGTRVTVAHPLLLGTATKAWAEVFADYGILQPFPQLDRPTFTDPRPLTRFVGSVTTGGRALGLRSRGWEIDDPDRFGSQFQLDLPGDVAVVVAFDPGMDFGSGEFDPKVLQTVGEVRLTGEATLDPVGRSEVLRDLTHVLARHPEGVVQ